MLLIICPRFGRYTVAPVSGSLQKAEGDGPNARQTAAELLPLVYGELRHLAAARLAQEKPGQTLAPTALVHEAFLRLNGEKNRSFVDSKHFYCAAATAMRRILIENARRKARVKHGVLLEQVNLVETALAIPLRSENLLALDEALDRFAALEPEAARLVELRYFVGMSHQEAAGVLGISRRAADGLWSYARAWLLADMHREPGHTELPGKGETQA
jgi:RNA polymerase sigma factor (TIGR02999 family)